MIDLFKPYVPNAAVDAVSEVLKTRWIGQGPKVEEFEAAFCKMFHVKHAISLSSGTAALETAYDLCNIGPGDEVITTPLTCTATNLPLLRRGAKIVWADILEDTLCIDPVDALSKTTFHTKAFVQVHLGGIRAGLREYMKEFEGDYAFPPVVSDAAQALGIFNGTYNCFSFQAIKHITTGDGGMFTCDWDLQAHRAKLLRWFGIDREKKIANNWQAYRERKMTFDIEEIGAKRHMNDIAAAMGIEGLKVFDDVILHRSTLFDIYQRRLKDVAGIRLLDGPENKFWLATVLVDRRDDFARVMFEAEIDTNVVQVRNDIYKVFGGKRADLPVMNKVEEQYLCLPIGMHVSADDVNYICDRIERGW